MRKCNNCNVALKESEPICPLCFEKIDEVGSKEMKGQETEVSYPKYENIVSNASPLRNAPLFATITAIIICVYINIFTHDKGEILWSILASASVLYTFLIQRIMRKRVRYGKKVLQVYYFTSILLITIDFSTGSYYWSTDYVFPFLTVFTLFYLTMLASRSKELFSEYFGFMITVTITSFSSVIIFFFGLSSQGWGAFIALITCVLITLALYLFADKTLKKEIRKRFHQ